MTKTTRIDLVTRLAKEITLDTLSSEINGCYDDSSKTFASKEEIRNLIYAQVMKTNSVVFNGGYIPVKEDIRFLTTDTIMEIINGLLVKRYEKAKAEAEE